MGQVKITFLLLAAILLQWTMRNVAEPLAYIDFPLIVVVYAALQRNSVRALFYGSIAGIATDALSGGLLGANGFSKTLIAYVVSEIARRVYLDNLLLRFPVLAGACFLDDLVYFGMHKMLGQQPAGEIFPTITYSLAATTLTGMLAYLILENMASEGFRRKRKNFFSPKRRTRRRNPIRLGRR